VLVFLSQVDDDGPLLGDKQQMNPNKVMEDPPCGWRLGRVAFLGLCRKFCSGDRSEAVTPVSGVIRQPGHRTVRPA
jgi:hypothetical protein